MNDRETILGALTEPVGDKPLTLPSFAPNTSDDLWRAFTLRLEALNGKRARWTDLSTVQDRNWIVEPYINVPKAAGDYCLTSAWDASLGITSCTVAVAETGSILIRHEPSGHRLASLTPPHHVVVARQASIVWSLEEAFALLDHRNAVLITGPSRTADIEGVLVNGVHGPAELWVIVEEG